MKKIIDLKKKEQRIASSKIREEIKLKNNYDDSKLFQKISNLISFKKSKIIATFISFKTEIDTTNLNKFLINSNKIICLPVVKNKSEYLVFRKFNSKTSLKKGRYGTLEPDDKSEELIPDFIITPCLAFDERGYRIGYGGGYYDKTFSKFNKIKHRFISTAIAFDEQKVKYVVHDSYDQKIDFVITEKRVYAF